MAAAQLLFLLVEVAACCMGLNQLPSTFESLRGHYPPVFCRATNAMLNAADGQFLYSGDGGEDELHTKCDFSPAVWPMQNVDSKEIRCDKTFKSGIAYTIFYWSKTSNYYHLTYDMQIPLFKHMYLHGNHTQYEAHDVVFMPTVESKRLKVLDWDTIAFEDPNAYWYQMSEFIAGDFAHLPLDRTLLNKNENVCFEELFFGVPKVNYKDEEFIRAFVKHMKGKLGIEEKRPAADRMALVSRKGRRKLLNEVELVDALQEVIPTDLVEFSGMSFEEQVRSMQQYTVFAALNGAGLMNALYLPEHSTAIQMVPYKAGLNVKQYGDLIRNRGPYMEWINMHEHLHHPTKGDTYNNRPDTTVHIEEFKDLVIQAMAASKQAYLQSLKTEL